VDYFKVLYQNFSEEDEENKNPQPKFKPGTSGYEETV
jgi:hypothetical protein